MKIQSTSLLPWLLAILLGIAAGCGDANDEPTQPPLAATATSAPRAWDNLRFEEGVRVVRSCGDLPEGAEHFDAIRAESPNGTEVRWAFMHFDRVSDTTYALVMYAGDDTTGCSSNIDRVVFGQGFTGLPEIDTVIRTTIARDLATFVSLLEYVELGCASPRYVGDPPGCWPGESPGATVVALSVTECASGWQRREEIDALIDRLFRFVPPEFSLWAAFRSADREDVRAVFPYGPGSSTWPPGFALTISLRGRIIGVEFLCDDVDAYVPEWGSVEFLVPPLQVDDFDAGAKFDAAEAWMISEGRQPSGMCGTDHPNASLPDAWCYDYFRTGALRIDVGPRTSGQRFTLWLNEEWIDGQAHVFSVAQVVARAEPAPSPTPRVQPDEGWRMSRPDAGIYAWSAVTGAVSYRVSGTLTLFRENAADPCLPPLAEETRTLSIDEVIDAADRSYAVPLPPLPAGDRWYVTEEEMLRIEAVGADGVTILSSTGMSSQRDVYC